MRKGGERFLEISEGREARKKTIGKQLLTVEIGKWRCLRRARATNPTCSKNGEPKRNSRKGRGGLEIKAEEKEELFPDEEIYRFKKSPSPRTGTLRTWTLEHFQDGSKGCQRGLFNWAEV